MLRVVYAIVRLGYGRKIIFFQRLCSLLAPFRLPSMDFLQASWFFRVSKHIDCPHCGFFCHKDCKRDVSRSRYDPEEFQYLYTFQDIGYHNTTAIFSVGSLKQIFCGHISLLILCKISSDKRGSYSKPYHFARSLFLLWKAQLFFAH